MIAAPFSEHVERNRARCKHDQEPCFLCGRPLNMDARGTRWVRTLRGDTVAMDEEVLAANSGADTGGYPIGPTCWKNHPELHAYENGGEG